MRQLKPTAPGWSSSSLFISSSLFLIENFTLIAVHIDIVIMVCSTPGHTKHCLMNDTRRGFAARCGNSEILVMMMTHDASDLRLQTEIRSHFLSITATLYIASNLTNTGCTLRQHVLARKSSNVCRLPCLESLMKYGILPFRGNSRYRTRPTTSATKGRSSGSRGSTSCSWFGHTTVSLLLGLC